MAEQQTRARTRRAVIALALVAALGALLPAPGDGKGDRGRPCPYGVVASPDRLQKALSGQSPGCRTHRDRP